MLEQKQKTGGVNASKENDALIAKQIRLLENRLDKELVKFNQALAEVGGQWVRARPFLTLTRAIYADARTLRAPVPFTTQNKSLRERIDRLRKDRVIFDNVYKRLESSLHEKKNEMVRVR